MQNVKATVNGTTLTLEVDLAQRSGRSVISALKRNYPDGV